MSEEDFYEWFKSSGENQRALEYFRGLLENSGWYDDVHAIALREAGAQDSEDFDKLVEKVMPQALKSAPLIPQDLLRFRIEELIKSYENQKLNEP